MGDNGRVGGWRTSYPEGRHGFRVRRARTANTRGYSDRATVVRSGRTGKHGPTSARCGRRAPRGDRSSCDTFREFAQQRFRGRHQGRERDASGFRRRAHQVRSLWKGYLTSTFDGFERRSEPPSDAVAHHRGADPAGERIRDADPIGRCGEEGDPKRATSHASRRPAELHEGVTAGDALDQADSRSRPRRRRDFTMLRPARVAMRWRKPWRLARLRTLG